MATTTHYIRSYYDADEQREGLLQQTGQMPDSKPSQENEPEVDPWQTESSSFGPSRLTASAPAFVPAALSYEEVNEAMGNGISNPFKTSRVVRGKKSEISGWYKCLNRQSASTPTTPQLHSSSGSASPALLSVASTSKPADLKRTNHRRKDWFISNVLEQSSSSTPSFTPTSTPPPSTLADILARDPPTDTSHVPPVWIQIGPSNPGYVMLQRSGWSEGEGLGSSVARRYDPVSSLSRTGKERGVKNEENEEELIEVPLNADVIDLTLSDSEAEDEFDGKCPVASPITGRPVLDHGGKALLTPLPTTLKSDRLGIGLKAKTIGPYRSSQKRVTHNAAAMAAHIKANEDMRKLKGQVGRGSRGFAKLDKLESAKRQNLLAYLNS